MFEKLSTIFLLCCSAQIIFADENNVIRTPRTDSYLDAYQESHVNNHPLNLKKKTDRDYSEPYPSAPQPVYGPPQPAYGPPQQPQYGPPAAPVYGPPAPVYGPPLQPIYGIPYGLGLSLLDKLKFKLDLFTIGKIILKLVIFKKIVSLIAILCLLLFIPSLKHKGGNNNGSNEGGDDDMRTFGPKKYKAGDEVLSNLSGYVMGAIDDYAKKHPNRERCDSVYCKTKRVVEKIDAKITDEKLAKLYSKEK